MSKTRAFGPFFVGDFQLKAKMKAGEWGSTGLEPATLPSDALIEAVNNLVPARNSHVTNGQQKEGISEEGKASGFIDWDGAPSRIRTCDPCLRRAVLYPAELWARNDVAVRR